MSTRLSSTLEYYDTVLIAMAVSLVGGGLAGVVTGLGLRVGLFVGATLATVFMFDALFRSPPDPARAPTVVAVVLAWAVFLGGLVAAL